MTDIIAVFSLNHPTQPKVRVRILQEGPGLFRIEEYQDDVHVRDHHFPAMRTERAIRREAKAILKERRR